MRPQIRTLVAVVAVAATVPGAALAAAPSPCRSLTVASAEETQGKPGVKFSAAKTIDLTFRLQLDAGVTGDHVVELRVFTPRGFLYRSITAPVALGAAAASSPKERAVGGYPRPQRVVRSTAAKLGAETVNQIELAFPVGGTDIVGSSLYGRWRVQPFLDGAADPCGGDAAFRITP
jgi:hypothetical protein